MNIKPDVSNTILHDPSPMHEARHRPVRRNPRLPAYCETGRPVLRRTCGLAFRAARRPLTLNDHCGNRCLPSVPGIQKRLKSCSVLMRPFRPVLREPTPSPGRCMVGAEGWSFSDRTKELGFKRKAEPGLKPKLSRERVRGESSKRDGQFR